LHQGNNQTDRQQDGSSDHNGRPGSQDDAEGRGDSRHYQRDDNENHQAYSYLHQSPTQADVPGFVDLLGCLVDPGLNLIGARFLRLDDALVRRLVNVTAELVVSATNLLLALLDSTV